MSRIPLSQIQQDIHNLRFKSQGKVYSNVELCKVEKVDTETKTVSAYFFDTGKIRDNVPYCFPFYNKGNGIIFVPTQGSLGVAVWDTYGRPHIITFTSPATKNKDLKETRNIPELGKYNLPDLLEGEVLFSSNGNSYIMLDNLGGLTLSSSLFGYIYLDENGNYELDVENAEININGTLTEKYTENYKEILRVVKGKHFYESTQFSGGGVELCYRIEVICGEEEKGFFGVGTDGNFYYRGDFIRLE